MGICDSAHNQSHLHNNNSTSTSQKKEQTNIEQQNNPANSYSLTEPIQIVNRLSEKSKFADINKYITITDVFLGKGATGIVREGTNSKGEKFAVKTVWKADVDQNECFKREIDFSGFSNSGLKELCQSMLERDPNKRFSAFQALEKLKLIGGGNMSDQTVPSNFNPDIQKIMVILNDRALTDELRNLFLDKLSYLDIVKVFKDFKKNSYEQNDKDLNDMMTGNIYMKAGQLIDKALKLDYLKEDFKNILKQFRDNKGEEKVMRQMINVSKFFITALESKKFIRKQRCLNTFKNYDKNRGYLTYYQINQIFIDKVKKDRLKNLYNQNSKIYFEDFYQMWNKYDDVVYDEELRYKSKKNLLK